MSEFLAYISYPPGSFEVVGVERSHIYIGEDLQATRVSIDHIHMF